MKQRYTWNTGRPYDRDGKQLMVAEVHTDEIKFSDLSRYINGVVPLGKYLKGKTLTNSDIEGIVMHNYDYGNYSSLDITLECSSADKWI